MCYRVHVSDRQHEGAPQPPEGRGLPSFRPRIVGALAVALVAIAALLSPGSTPAVSSESTAAPVAVSNVKVPDRSGTVIEQTSTTVDDGVPSSAEVARSTPYAGAGHCNHGL